MAVKIKIAQVLQQFTDQNEIVEIDGSTVKQCLDNLVRKYPGVEKWIFDPNNSPLVIVLLNKELVLPEKLDTGVTGADRIDLIPMIAGG
jgi:sulfur-carrier protein